MRDAGIGGEGERQSAGGVRALPGGGKCGRLCEGGVAIIIIIIIIKRKKRKEEEKKKAASKGWEVRGEGGHGLRGCQGGAGVHPGSCPIGTATRACQQRRIIGARALGRRGRGVGEGTGHHRGHRGHQGHGSGLPGLVRG